MKAKVFQLTLRHYKFGCVNFSWEGSFVVRMQGRCLLSQAYLSLLVSVVHQHSVLHSIQLSSVLVKTDTSFFNMFSELPKENFFSFFFLF